MGSEEGVQKVRSSWQSRKIGDFLEVPVCGNCDICQESLHPKRQLGRGFSPLAQTEPRPAPPAPLPVSAPRGKASCKSIVHGNAGTKGSVKLGSGKAHVPGGPACSEAPVPGPPSQRRESKQSPGISLPCSLQLASLLPLPGSLRQALTHPHLPMTCLRHSKTPSCLPRGK